MSRRRDAMELARGVVPLVLGIVLILISVLWVAFTLFLAFLPALALLATLLLARGALELRRPSPDRRR